MFEICELPVPNKPEDTNANPVARSRRKVTG